MRAVVTGAGSGIGRAIALALEGHVTLVGRRREALEAVGGDVFPADVTRDDDLHALAAHVGDVDVLVHSAGIHRFGDAAEDFDEQYRTNVRGPHVLTRLLLPGLRRCGGQVVFLNSSAGLTARAGVGPYAATKHALRALADALRDEVNRDGVRVLSVYCGRTAGPMQQALHAAEGRGYRPERLIQPEDVARVVTAALALPRTVEMTDVHLRPMQPPV